MAVKDTDEKGTVDQKNGDNENKKTVKKRGRPLGSKNKKKRAVTKKKVVRKTTTKKKRVVKKRVAKKAPATVADNTTPRRGRPVSVDVLQNKLTIAQESLKRERERRVNQVAAIREKLTVVTKARQELQKELAVIRKTQLLMEMQQREAERETLRQEKMDKAKRVAVEKFLTKWEQKYLADEARKTNKKRGKRGRPRKKS